MHTVRSHGASIPALGFGTARFDDADRCRRAVEHALAVGYRHVDTAQMYDTEAAVGAALSAASVDREAVFLTTKLDVGNRRRERVRESTMASLEALGTDHVDLLLIHSPNRSVSHAETLAAMNALREEGHVRHLGVSNFSVAQLREARDLSDAPIVTDQVEYNPHHGQADLLEYCIDAGVVLTAYSPLDVGAVTDNATLASIGDVYDKTAAQVALRWLVQQPMVAAIPKAASEDHIEANLEVFDFELTPGEMDRIFAGIDLSSLGERIRS